MTTEMERLKEIEARKAELRDEVVNAEEARMAEIHEEATALATEEKELRTKIEINTALEPGAAVQEERTMENNTEKRELVDGKMEVRALLSTGSIAKPTKVDGINGIAVTESSIVDDIKAVPLTGNGAYVVAYVKNGATAVDVTDGAEIGGTEAAFDYVTINPAEWGITGSISKQVAKVSPLAYETELKASALNALRAKAEQKITAAILASDLLETASLAIDANFLRQLVISHKSIAGKGGVKLYLNREDLIKLGAVRGTNEKKALYEISFEAGSGTNGTIKEGGMAVPFSVSEFIPAGTQLFGQPQTVEMPMWDNYSIETDESVYFTKNLIAYRGVQTANADLCALHGMTKVTQPSK